MRMVQVVHVPFACMSGRSTSDTRRLLGDRFRGDVRPPLSRDRLVKVDLTGKPDRRLRGSTRAMDRPAVGGVMRGTSVRRVESRPGERQ